jgi:DNA-binding LacI/PurR family transcriptional regulator
MAPDEYAHLTTKLVAIMRERIRNLRSSEMVRLPPERNLALELGVSRQTLRKAIKTLVGEGTLVQKQGSGTYVVPRLRIAAIHLVKASDLKWDDPFYLSFLSEISDHLSRDSIPLLVVKPTNIPPVMDSMSLIIVGYLSQDIYEQLRRKYTSIVAVQSHPMYRDITQIDTDYYKIGYDAAMEFVKNNHKNILHLAGPDEYPAAAARRRGFQDALKNTQVNGDIIVGKMNWEYGYTKGAEIVRDYCKKKKVTGVFAANDWMATGLMTRLTEIGFRVPDDVSVIGCDDTLVSREILPGLSTFKEDFQLIISTVYASLNEMSFSRDYFPRQVLLPARFVRRGSLKTL